MMSGQRFGDVVMIDFQVGNTFKEITENIKITPEGEECRYSWTVFLRIKDRKLRGAIGKLVSSVRFGMWGIEYLERHVNDLQN